MTLGIKKIWGSTNKVLTTINMMLLALILMGVGPTNVKEGSKIKIPLVYNILLLIVLGTILSFLIYGIYRKTTV
jgi:hypothetical protein